jgi:chemotaxis protein MotB
VAGKKGGHGGGGGHGGAWVISFADLMSLLMAFFVMLLSFSVQDQEKLNMAAGSVQNAFGIQPYSDMTGMIERKGNPERDYLKAMSPEEMKASTQFANKDHKEFENQGQEANTWTKEQTDVERQQEYALAAASLKQAWQDQPDITAVQDNIVVEQTEEGLNIVLADQDGRAMFPKAASTPTR